MSDYNIREAFEKIEDELINSMMRNFSRHRAEETKEGYNWTQWQAEQLKSLEEYRKHNAKKFGKRFKTINGKVEEMIRTAKADGNASQEAEILEAIFNIPWGHQKHIITKAKSTNEALFYVQKTIKQGWSRNILINYMSANLFETEGKAISNFKNTLPALQSDLAQQTLKDPYNFDFLTLRDSYLERELEDALTDNITKFFIELGNGFAYVGRQVRLEIGGDEFFIDLLFYHLKLRSYVVIESKTGDFQPEYIGKLGFYVSAINNEMKLPQDNPTIGLLICKSKNNIVARYTLDTANLPIGISEYDLNHLFPKDFKSTLPSIEEIENELKD